jgi:hypothetical protein
MNRLHCDPSINISPEAEEKKKK